MENKEENNLELENDDIVIMNCPFTKSQYETIQEIIKLEKNISLINIYYRIIDNCVIRSGVPSNKITISRKVMHEIGKELGIDDLRIENIQNKIKNGEIKY